MESLGVELLLDRNPAAIEAVHGLVKIVFVKGLALLAKPAGRRQKSAAGLFNQRQFSARKKDATKDHGLQKPALANLGHIGKKLLQSETLPSIPQHGQATVVQRIGQLDLFQHNAGLTPQSSSHQIADLWRQGPDVAHRARAWTLGSAKRLAHQVRDIGFALPTRFGGLHEHTCYRYRALICLQASKSCKVFNILLATKSAQKLQNTREN